MDVTVTVSPAPITIEHELKATNDKRQI